MTPKASSARLPRPKKGGLVRSCKSWELSGSRVVGGHTSVWSRNTMQLTETLPCSARLPPFRGKQVLGTQIRTWDLSFLLSVTLRAPPGLGAGHRHLCPVLSAPRGLGGGGRWRRGGGKGLGGDGRVSRRRAASSWLLPTSGLDFLAHALGIKNLEPLQ